MTPTESWSGSLSSGDASCCGTCSRTTWDLRGAPARRRRMSSGPGGYADPICGCGHAPLKIIFGEVTVSRGWAIRPTMPRRCFRETQS